jgi:hypothetical protein
MSKAGRGSDQFMVRFREGMRDEIRLAAESAGRSMNEEILRRLEQTIVHGDNWDADIVVKRLLACLLFDKGRTEKEAAIFEAYSFLAGLHLSSADTLRAWERLRPAGKMLGLTPLDRAEIDTVVEKMVAPELETAAEFLRHRGWTVEPPPPDEEDQPAIAATPTVSPTPPKKRRKQQWPPFDD